jgi:hypothetical protein
MIKLITYMLKLYYFDMNLCHYYFLKKIMNACSINEFYIAIERKSELLLKL